MEEAKNDNVNSYLDWSDQGKAGFWHYAIGLVIMLVIFFGLSGFGVTPLALLVPDYKKSLLLSAVGILLGFVISFFVIPPLVKIIHSRPFWSVAMPKWEFRKWDFWVSFWVGMAAAVVFGLVFSILGFLPLKPNPDFDLTTLLVLVVVAFIGVFIQAGAEELLFRGYITQFVKRFSSNKILFLGIPAVLFALPHIGNISSQVSGGYWVMLPYVINGLLLGWAAYRSGSLWMALGLHLANNYSSTVLIGTIGDALPSAAPFVIQLTDNLPLLTTVVAVRALAIAMVVNYLIKKREAGR